MSSDIWNPWHGCRKYSEGCDHCYMYYLDNEWGKSGGEIYKVKTNFDLYTCFNAAKYCFPNPAAVPYSHLSEPEHFPPAGRSPDSRPQLHESR